MHYIFKSLIVLSVIISTFHNPSLHATILDEPEALRAMIGSGVPVAAIFPARKEQTSETITNLALAAAPHYPLGEILALYPTDEAAAGAAAETSAGEEAFFEACAKDPELYAKVFHAFTRPYFVVGNFHYNPLDPKQSLFVTTDKTQAIYTPISLSKPEVQPVQHTLPYPLLKLSRPL